MVSARMSEERLRDYEADALAAGNWFLSAWNANEVIAALRAERTAYERECKVSERIATDWARTKGWTPEVAEAVGNWPAQALAAARAAIEAQS